MALLPRELIFVVRRALVSVAVVPSTAPRLALRAQAGRGLVIEVPPGVAEADVRAFITPHLPRLSRYLTVLARQVYYSLSEQFIILWGRRLRLEVLTGFAQPGLTVRGSVVYLRCAVATEAALVAALATYAKPVLVAELARQLPRYEQKLALKRHAVVVHNYQRKWACNYLREGRLGFHGHLIHFPKATLTYLIVHELAHDVHPRHDQAFWAYVQEHCPDYASHEALLAFRVSFHTD